MTELEARVVRRAATTPHCAECEAADRATPYRDVLVTGTTWVRKIRDEDGNVVRLERIDPRDVVPGPYGKPGDPWLTLAVILITLAAVVMAASLLVPWR